MTGADWLPIALISRALVWLLVWRGISLTARSVIAVGAVSLLIAALIVVIFVRLGTGNAPVRQTLTPDVFKLPRGTGLAAVGFACTYGICCSAASSRRSQLAKSHAGPPRQSRTAPLGDLALAYVGPAVAAVLDVAAVLSALRAALVGVAVASRTLYAPARDRILASALATVSHQTGASIGAATASMLLKFALLLASGLAGTGALDAFFCPAATGALSLLMVYVLASVSVLRLYVLFRNLIPGPAFPYSLLP